MKNSINPEILMEYFVICRGNDIIELKPDGYDIPITNENKDEYI